MDGVTATLDRTGVLRVGKLTIQIGDSKPTYPGHWRLDNKSLWRDKPLLFRVVKLSTSLKAVHVREIVKETPDTIQFLHTVVLLKPGKLVKVLEQRVVGWEHAKLTFPGDGTARYADSPTVFRLNRDQTALIKGKAPR